MQALERIENLEYQETDAEDLVSDAIDKLSLVAGDDEEASLSARLQAAISRITTLPTESEWNAAQAEKDKLEENDIRIPLDENSNDVTAFLAKQAVKATSKLKIRAIITDSYSGRTARNLAAFRGKYPVLAICYKEKTMRHLALSDGVEGIFMPELANGQEYYFAALRRLLKEGRLQPSDMVGYLSSGKAGTKTSFLEINVVEDALKHAEETVLPNNNRYL